MINFLKGIYWLLFKRFFKFTMIAILLIVAIIGISNIVEINNFNETVEKRHSKLVKQKYYMALVHDNDKNTTGEIILFIKFENKQYCDVLIEDYSAPPYDGTCFHNGREIVSRDDVAVAKYDDVKYEVSGNWFSGDINLILDPAIFSDTIGVLHYSDTDPIRVELPYGRYRYASLDGWYGSWKNTLSIDLAEVSSFGSGLSETLTEKYE